MYLHGSSLSPHTKQLNKEKIMKSEIVTAKEFQPVTIQLTFETFEELQVIYELGNASNQSELHQIINEERGHKINREVIGDVLATIYKLLRPIARP